VFIVIAILFALLVSIKALTAVWTKGHGWIRFAMIEVETVWFSIHLNPVCAFYTEIDIPI
jgi:hypothetical protein